MEVNQSGLPFHPPLGNLEKARRGREWIERRFFWLGSERHCFLLATGQWGEGDASVRGWRNYQLYCQGVSNRSSWKREEGGFLQKSTHTHSWWCCSKFAFSIFKKLRNAEIQLSYDNCSSNPKAKKHVLFSLKSLICENLRQSN